MGENIRQEVEQMMKFAKYDHKSDGQALHVNGEHYVAFQDTGIYD